MANLIIHKENLFLINSVENRIFHQMKKTRHKTPSSIYKFSLNVCLYPINIKTAEPIGPNFCVGHHGTTGKVYK